MHACGQKLKKELNSQETAPTNGCGSPQYATDQWCDDDNNNAGCNFDGGACCSTRSFKNYIDKILTTCPILVDILKNFVYCYDGKSAYC